MATNIQTPPSWTTEHELCPLCNKLTLAIEEDADVCMAPDCDYILEIDIEDEEDDSDDDAGESSDYDDEE